MSTPSPRSTRLARSAMGARLAGFIYGTIVVLSVVVGGARAYAHEPGHIAVLVLAASVTFWLAHVYAHGLGHAVGHEEHLTLAEIRQIARRELSIVEAALPPAGALLLGALGILSTKTAVWLALGLGLAVLTAQGIVFARVERLGPVATLVVVTVNLALGLLLVLLKLLFVH
jgi:hypothetical protein